MGALQGTLTYTLFYVKGETEDGFVEKVVDMVEERAFKPLDPEQEDEEHYGWVPVESPLRVEFERHNIVFDNFVNLGLRHDKYAIPGGLLKAHVSQAERQYMVDHNKERVTKFEREDIKVMVRAGLKEKSLPRMKVIDMSWDMTAGRVRFWNQSPKTCELFQELFKDTFGLDLVPANPYTTAIEIELTPDQVEMLVAVEPATFADQAMAIGALKPSET